MSSLILSKILVFLLIFVGEFLVIYAEISMSEIVSKNTYRDKRYVLLYYIFLIIFAGCILLIGFMLGIQYYHSIWVVNVISTTLVLIIEPLVAYSIFKSLPSKNTTTGLGFGIVGLCCTLLF